jgi:membrane protease YdiL (CAAX protease family)
VGEAYGFEVGEVGLVLALVVTHYLCTPTPVAVQDRPKGRGLVRPTVALAGTITVLAVWNVGIRPNLAEAWHVPAGLLVAGVTVALGLSAGLGVSGLGLSPDRLASGTRWGGVAAGSVLAVVVVGVLLPVTRSSYDVPRAHTSLGDLLLDVLVVIPISTVVVEELAFRGTLLGLLVVLLPRGWAIAGCSLLFGLWHLDGVLTSSTSSAGTTALAGLGTVVATGLAGAAFCWLRLQSGSLLAPVFAHLSTNTIALVAGWILFH